jgi:hypothetical protein
MNKGDIFRWSYKNVGDTFMPYHCCSCIAEFDGEILRDTYWSGMSDGKWWKPQNAEALLDLEFIANRDDLVQADPSAVDFYSRDDIVDLRHANNSSRSNVYLRKGAKRSANVMRETLNYAIERAESEIRMLRSKIERAQEQLAAVDAGNTELAWIESARA